MTSGIPPRKSLAQKHCQQTRYEVAILLTNQSINASRSSEEYLDFYKCGVLVFSWFESRYLRAN